MRFDPLPLFYWSPAVYDEHLTGESVKKSTKLKVSLFVHFTRIEFDLPPYANDLKNFERRNKKQLKLNIFVKHCSSNSLWHQILLDFKVKLSCEKKKFFNHLCLKHFFISQKIFNRKVFLGKSK